MRIIISPAKKMKADTDTLPWKDLPCFLEQAETLYSKLQGMSRQELQALWQCSDALTARNARQLESTPGLRAGLTPALLAYQGIQYQYMAPGVFTDGEFAYVQEHLRILSGLYGVLRPLDGVVPYRLEMQARLETESGKDLYSYWGNLLADQLYRETDCVVNLASKEYSLCVSRHQKPGTQLITCVFGEELRGKVVEKGTLCKMARGEMVRYLAQIRGEEPEALRGFNRLHYTFSPEHSDETTYVFLRQEGAKEP